MQITKKQWIGTGVGLVLVVLVAMQYAKPYAPAVGPISTSTLTLPATTTDSAVVTLNTINTSTSASTKPFPINAADAAISWNFKGSSSGNEVLIKNANADIAFLTGLIGKGKYDDYDLYNGIANDYGMLGDGTRAYQNFNRAISIHPAKGLAYVNLGHLMDQLGAPHTAVDAYKKSVTVEPGMLQYHIERLNYLTEHFESDNVLINAAFADVSKQFGDNASILAIKAQWFTRQGKYEDAIKAWQTAKMLLPGKDTSAIDAEIARLQAKK